MFWNYKILKKVKNINYDFCLGCYKHNWKF
jgi:hypothetical protein